MARLDANTPIERVFQVLEPQFRAPNFVRSHTEKCTNAYVFFFGQLFDAQDETWQEIGISPDVRAAVLGLIPAGFNSFVPVLDDPKFGHSDEPDAVADALFGSRPPPTPRPNPTGPGPGVGAGAKPAGVGVQTGAEGLSRDLDVKALMRVYSNPGVMKLKRSFGKIDMDDNGTISPQEVGVYKATLFPANPFPHVPPEGLTWLEYLLYHLVTTDGLLPADIAAKQPREDAAAQYVFAQFNVWREPEPPSLPSLSRPSSRHPSLSSLPSPSMPNSTLSRKFSFPTQSPQLQGRGLPQPSPQLQGRGLPIQSPRMLPQQSPLLRARGFSQESPLVRARGLSQESQLQDRVSQQSPQLAARKQSSFNDTSEASSSVYNNVTQPDARRISTPRLSQLQLQDLPQTQAQSQFAVSAQQQEEERERERAREREKEQEREAERERARQELAMQEQKLREVQMERQRLEWERDQLEREERERIERETNEARQQEALEHQDYEGQRSQPQRPQHRRTNSKPQLPTVEEVVGQEEDDLELFSPTASAVQSRRASLGTHGVQDQERLLTPVRAGIQGSPGPPGGTQRLVIHSSSNSSVGPVGPDFSIEAPGTAPVLRRLSYTNSPYVPPTQQPPLLRSETLRYLDDNVRVGALSKIFQNPEVKALKMRFDTADSNSNGWVSLEEFESRYEVMFPHLDLSNPGNRRALFAELDTNHDGQITWFEYLTYVTSTHPNSLIPPSELDRLEHMYNKVKARQKNNAAQTRREEFFRKGIRRYLRKNGFDAFNQGADRRHSTQSSGDMDDDSSFTSSNSNSPSDSHLQPRRTPSSFDSRSGSVDVRSDLHSGSVDLRPSDPRSGSANRSGSVGSLDLQDQGGSKRHGRKDQPKRLKIRMKQHTQQLHQHQPSHFSPGPLNNYADTNDHEAPNSRSDIFEARRCFEQVDIDRKGYVTRDEFLKYSPLLFPTYPVLRDEGELVRLFTLVDLDQDGVVSWEDYASYTALLRGEDRGLQVFSREPGPTVSYPSDFHGSDTAMSQPYIYEDVMLSVAAGQAVQAPLRSALRRTHDVNVPSSSAQVIRGNVQVPVDSAPLVSDEETLRKNAVVDIKRRFEKWDQDRDGHLSWSDVAAGCTDLFPNSSGTVKELMATFEIVDHDSDGQISWMDFLQYHTLAEPQLLLPRGMIQALRKDYESRPDCNPHDREGLKRFVRRAIRQYNEGNFNFYNGVPKASEKQQLRQAPSPSSNYQPRPVLNSLPRRLEFAPLNLPQKPRQQAYSQQDPQGHGAQNHHRQPLPEVRGQLLNNHRPSLLTLRGVNMNSLNRIHAHPEITLLKARYDQVDYDADGFIPEGDFVTYCDLLFPLAANRDTRALLARLDVDRVGGLSWVDYLAHHIAAEPSKYLSPEDVRMLELLAASTSSSGYLQLVRRVAQAKFGLGFTPPAIPLGAGQVDPQQRLAQQQVSQLSSAQNIGSPGNEVDVDALNRAYQNPSVLELKRAFDQADVDADGVIAGSDFQAKAWVYPRLCPSLLAAGVPIVEAVKRLDKNGDGNVSWMELLTQHASAAPLRVLPEPLARGLLEHYRGGGAEGYLSQAAVAFVVANYDIFKERRSNPTEESFRGVILPFNDPSTESSHDNSLQENVREHSHNNISQENSPAVQPEVFPMRPAPQSRAEDRGQGQGPSRRTKEYLVQRALRHIARNPRISALKRRFDRVDLDHDGLVGREDVLNNALVLFPELHPLDESSHAKIVRLAEHHGDNSMSWAEYLTFMMEANHADVPPAVIRVLHAAFGERYGHQTQRPSGSPTLRTRGGVSYRDFMHQGIKLFVKRNYDAFPGCRPVLDPQAREMFSSEVAHWLRAMGQAFEAYIPAFVRHGFTTFKVLASFPLSDLDLQELGVESRLHRRRILHEMELLRELAKPTPPPFIKEPDRGMIIHSPTASRSPSPRSHHSVHSGEITNGNKLTRAGRARVGTARSQMQRTSIDEGEEHGDENNKISGKLGAGKQVSTGANSTKGAGVPVIVELTVACRNLIRTVKGSCNPIIGVFHQEEQGFRLLDQTEWQLNQRDPQFERPLVLEVWRWDGDAPKAPMELIFGVYHVEHPRQDITRADLIGEVFGLSIAALVLEPNTRDQPDKMHVFPLSNKAEPKAQEILRKNGADIKIRGQFIQGQGSEPSWSVISGYKAGSPSNIGFLK